MAQWKALSVKEAIIKIKDGEIVLPVIQRRLVWEEDKMELLFDSLLKGNSFGSIICIEEEKNSKPLFAYRDFTQDGNPVASHEVNELLKTQWFIIDGQQRLQSFYIGLTGTINSKRLYFDLLSDGDNMEYEFKFAENEDKLPKSNNERSISECRWYSVNDLFQRLSSTSKARQISKEIVKKFNIEDTNKIETVENNVQDFFEAIFANDCIGLSTVCIDTDKNLTENRQRIVELFRRLNDGGTKLSSYDLVASMLKGFDYKMEAFLDDVVSENEDIKIDQDSLIKLLLILNDKPSKGMADLTAEDAEFAISKSDRIRETLKAVKIFLRASKNYEWFHNNRSTIPLYFLAYHIFYSDIDTAKLQNLFDQFDTKDDNYRNMANWLYVSLLNKVFSRGCGWIPDKTGIRKIHEVMKRNKGKEFPTNSLFDVYRSHPLYFTSKIDNNRVHLFDRDYVLYLIYDGQAKIRNEDIDHVHPRSLLQGRFDDWKINNVVNYQLLDSKTNRGEKNGKELSTWINKHIKSENVENYLRRHFIPENHNLWESENFEQFFEKREQMLADKINQYLITREKCYKI